MSARLRRQSDNPSSDGCSRDAVVSVEASASLRTETYKGVTNGNRHYQSGVPQA
jgi:hypothetical protein